MSDEGEGGVATSIWLLVLFSLFVLILDTDGLASFSPHLTLMLRRGRKWVRIVLLLLFVSTLLLPVTLYLIHVTMGGDTLQAGLLSSLALPVLVEKGAGQILSDLVQLFSTHRGELAFLQLIVNVYLYLRLNRSLSHRWEEKEFLNTLNVSLNTLTFQPAFPSTPNSSSNSGGVSESGEERKEGARNEGKRRKKNRRGGGKARGREDGWIEREGSSGGSSISLPSPLSPPRPIQALPHLIFRTVIEEELSSVIDWKGARVFLQERARATTTDMPFVCPNSDSEFDVHWWDVVMTILVNRISHHFREGFIDYAVGAEVVRKVFVFGLTFENYGEEFRKLRLILVEKDTLEDIVSNPSKYSNVVIEKKTFLPRLACIRIMAELYANEQQAMREVENRVGREGKRERERRNLSEGGGRSGGVVVELDKATVEMVKEDKEVQQQRMKGKLREVEIWRRSTSADGRS